MGRLFWKFFLSYWAALLAGLRRRGARPSGSIQLPRWTRTPSLDESARARPSCSRSAAATVPPRRACRPCARCSWTTGQRHGGALGLRRGRRTAGNSSAARSPPDALARARQLAATTGPSRSVRAGSAWRTAGPPPLHSRRASRRRSGAAAPSGRAALAADAAGRRARWRAWASARCSRWYVARPIRESARRVRRAVARDGSRRASRR